MDNFVMTIFGGYDTWSFALTIILGFIIGGTATALLFWWLFPIPSFCAVLMYGYFVNQLTTTSFAEEWVAGVAGIIPLLWILIAGLGIFRAASANWNRVRTNAEDC
jgi:chromate transport protein ChrA